MKYSINISRAEQKIRELPLLEKTYHIGRLPSNDIVLEGEEIQPRHARLIYQGDTLLAFKLEEGGADVLVNGRRIDSSVLSMVDEMAIGPYTFRFEKNADAAAINRSALKSDLHEELIKRLDLRKLNLEQVQSEDLRTRCDVVITESLQDRKIPAGPEFDRLKKEVLDEALGLGPLEELLADDTVTEIMVNSKDRIFVERKGKLQLTDLSVTSDAQLINIITRITTPLGRRIDESIPMVDARLADGSRVNAIIPPLSLHGPMITIRKFGKNVFTPDDYVKFGSSTLEMMEFLKGCVHLRKNIIISGGTGSGKTTFLNCLSSFIPPGERVLTIEDSAELKLPHQNLGSLEARPANIEGKGAIPIRELVRNALRMRPDRIVVGECRGGESLDMLQAMNTGHDGSLTTLHANNAYDATLRLETMVMMAGFVLPSLVIRQQIASAVNIIVQQSRLADGSRKVVEVVELCGLEGTTFNFRTLFRFEKTGIGPDGRYLGQFKATGEKPTFMDEFAIMGLKMNPELFTTGRELR